MAAAALTAPTKAEFAPVVRAPPMVQTTLEHTAPLVKTTALFAAVLTAAGAMKVNWPEPLNVSVPVMSNAAEAKGE
jgi:hypothetical protein